jgi:hypothetical protein
MNWIKTEDKLPKFNTVVLLLEKENSICSTGYLQSVDVNGNNWNTKSVDADFMSIFGGRTEKTIFKPNYWCEISLPENEV